MVAAAMAERYMYMDMGMYMYSCRKCILNLWIYPGGDNGIASIGITRMQTCKRVSNYSTTVRHPLN